MDIRNSPLWKEIKEVMEGGENPVHYSFSAQIIIDDQETAVSKVVQVEVTRQYVSKFSDETIVKFMLPLGFYHHQLIPNRSNFHVRLFREPVGEVTGDVKLEEDTDVRMYRGVLIDSKSALLEGSEDVSSSQEALDQNALKDVYIQLIDLGVERLRMKSIGGIYTDMLTSEVIQGVLSIGSYDEELGDEDALLGVDVVEGDNDERRDHTIIPHGEVRLVDVPGYIQEHAGGVYNTGIGSYIQNRIWSVYPQYALNRFDTTPANLTIINVPKRKLPGMERSYYSDGDRLIVIATGQSTHVDKSEQMQLNLGNGIRFSHAQRYLENFHQTSMNKSTVDRKSNTAEVLQKNRRTGLELAMMSPRRITANSYYELSTLAPREGSYLQIQWTNADPDLIYPGMPLKYVYLEGDDFNEIYGTVIGCDHMYALKGQGITESKYVAGAAITIFVEDHNKLEEG